MTAKRITPQQVAEVIRLATEDRMAQTAIADAVGCSRSTVQAVCRANGITCATRKNQGGKQVPVTQDDIDVWTELHLSGMGWDAIARRYGRHETTVRRCVTRELQRRTRRVVEQAVRYEDVPPAWLRAEAARGVKKVMIGRGALA